MFCTDQVPVLREYMIPHGVFCVLMFQAYLEILEILDMTTKCKVLALSRKYQGGETWLKVSVQTHRDLRR